MMRVLIVASDATAAETIRRALRYAPSCQVAGWVCARKLSEAPLAEAQPDVVVVDHSSDGESPLAQTRELRNSLPDAKIVLLADTIDPELLADAAAAGVDAAIAKSASPASVGMLVREVAAGNVFHFAPAAAPAAKDDNVTGILTARELEIVQLVAAGLSNGRIARQLWVTEQTVKFHLSNVYRKLGLVNRTEAAHYAYRNGLVSTAPSRGPVSVPVAA